MDGVDHYELLGVSRGASEAEIKAAYRSLARVMHPDAGGTSGTFRMLQEAYETLSDPRRRADYDANIVAGATAPMPRSSAGTRPGPAGRPHSQGRRQQGGGTDRRHFGGDPEFVPPAPRPDPDDLPWWHTIDPGERIRFLPATEYGHTPVLVAVAGWLLFLPGMLALAPTVLVLTMWLVPVMAVTGFLRSVPHRLPTGRAERAFLAEFGGHRVFGDPGAVRGEPAGRLTAELMAEYLTRLPGVRIFHGLSWPGSVLADVDHAVLCGRRLVLVESKMWLPGHYTADGSGTFRRNGRRFRGGATRLPESITAYRDLLPDSEVCGALVLYPSRAGEVTTGDIADVPAPPMTPEQFVRELGRWLSQEPATIDREAFRTVLDRLV
ncbi:DnaJ-like protein [Halopolyspora algeriensis]|uniref:DnaJ-like protein n=1 Tax=Halopolyspora algeriensis TaxID=1500506 RepID=A0A368VKR1_9ACTN|nr:DnaJ domain-containing protein [Halopolyspora algeriensis]RCW39581.1 DnaJ-like protein [Halopolyspora algeriensis]TQM56108.1 DnaJ-like protein [Halopolyspora algeriensis]